MAGENDVVIEAWNTILFDKFVRFKHLLIDGLAPHSNEALARPDFRRWRVLDVGCGFGDSTRVIAGRVGPAAAVGVDCAPNFVAAAGNDTRAAGIANARLLRRRRAGRSTCAGRTTSRSRASARCSS